MRYLFVLLLPFTGLLAAENAPKPAFSWNFNEATETDGRITIPEKVTGADLAVDAGTGVTIVDSSDVAGAKALAFDGTQSKPCSTVSKINSDTGMRLTFKLLLSEEERERSQGILQMPGIGIYAAREGPLHCAFSAKGGSEEERANKELVLPAPCGLWLTVSVSVKGSEIELQIDDKTLLGQLPEGAVFEPKEGKLAIGGLAANGGLVGQISDIRIFHTAE